MSHPVPPPPSSGRRVLVPGGTGAVGEGVVRAHLAAGADVVVPTRTQARADEFAGLLADVASDRLHLVVHDYLTFAGAEQLAGEMVSRLGGIDDVVAPIGGWWAGRSLWEVEEADWQAAFVGLATAHVAVLRAALPRLTVGGSYSLVVGASALHPVPGSGLVSMEQAALLMAQRVLDAELAGRHRAFALVLGPVRTRHVADGDPAWVGADQVGAVAVALAEAGAAPGRQVLLRTAVEAEQALDELRPVAAR